MAVGLSGQSFTASQGTAIAPNDTVQPSGLSITSAQGTAIGSSNNQVDVTGFSMSASMLMAMKLSVLYRRLSQ